MNRLKRYRGFLKHAARPDTSKKLTSKKLVKPTTFQKYVSQLQAQLRASKKLAALKQLRASKKLAQPRASEPIISRILAQPTSKNLALPRTSQPMALARPRNLMPRPSGPTASKRSPQKVIQKVMCRLKCYKGFLSFVPPPENLAPRASEPILSKQLALPRNSEPMTLAQPRNLMPRASEPILKPDTSKNWCIDVAVYYTKI